MRSNTVPNAAAGSVNRSQISGRQAKNQRSFTRPGGMRDDDIMEPPKSESSAEPSLEIEAKDMIANFNEVIEDHKEQFPERNLTFNSDIIIDSKDVLYTYNPKKDPEEEMQPSQNQVAEQEDANKKGKSALLSKLNDLYKASAEADSKYDPEEYHWELLQEWRSENVKYNCLRDITGYVFRAVDEEGFYKKQVLKCQKFFNRKLDDNPNKRNPGVDLNLLAHYEVNQLTGEKFLRLTIRQWKTEYDSELTKSGKNKQGSAESKGEEFEIQSLKFLKFDEELQEFLYEDEILYDISDQFLNARCGGFTNDIFITKNEHTYYFKKEIQVREEDGSEIYGFQLYRHSYGTHFQKFPIDNNPFPLHTNEKMDRYFIEAPEGKNLKDLQVKFLINASNEYSLRNDQLSEELNFLENQYIVVTDKGYMKVYEGYSPPNDVPTDIYIYKVSTGELLYDSTKDQTLERKYIDIQCGFFIKADQFIEEDNLKYHFCIKGKKFDYQIQIMDDGPEVMSESSRIFVKYKAHMIMSQNYKIKLERLGDQYNQSFFLNKTSCRVNFIYPLHSSKEENISSDIKNKQQEVSTHIQKYFLDNKSGRIAYQDSEFVFLEDEEFRKRILYEIEPKTGFDLDDEYISSQDMILKVNLSENCIYMWSLNPQFEYTSFREKLTEIMGDDKQLLQDIILQQYSMDNTTIYNDNYNMHDNLGIYQNQYLNRVYLTTREGIYLQHHRACMYDLRLRDAPNEVDLPENILVIDLGDKEGKLSMIKLFGNEKMNIQDKAPKQISDLKLVSYHISQTAKVVAFFFIQRNMNKQSGLYAQVNQSGVEFMVVHEISKLIQMAAKFSDGKCKMSVIEEGTPIFIFGQNVENIYYASYNRDVVQKYQDNSKAASMLASTLVHEMVHDPNNPIDKVVPFLFSSEVSRLPTPVFNWYLCFLDLEEVQKYKEKATTKNNKAEKCPFDQICNNNIFMIRDVEDPMIVDDKNGEQGDVRFENCRTRDCPLFCRSSPWSVHVQKKEKSAGVDFEDALFFMENDQNEPATIYSTRFQIGFVMNPEETQIFELTEYLINYNPAGYFPNFDLIDMFEQKKLLKDTKTHMQIEPYQIQHVMPSASSNEMFIGQQKFWENHRLVPRINNMGEISGVNFMLNLYMVYKENVMITDDTKLIEDEKKVLGDNYDIILENKGQEVILLKLTTQTIGLIYLESGRQYEVPLSILIDEREVQLSEKLEPKSLYIYQMLCVNDLIDDPHVQYKTPIMQTGYKQYALDYQPGNLITVCTTRFNKNVVEDQIFDRITMQYLLHKQQVEVITASIPSLKEIYKQNFLSRSQCYFQFRFFLNGRSFCSLDYPSFKNTIKNFSYAISKVECDHTKITGDSALYKMFDYSTDEDEDNSRSILGKIFQILHIQPQMNFVANWNFETFVQKSLDNNLNRPLLYLMDYLLNQRDDPHFKSVLMQDLPQLLVQDQVNIFQFLNEYQPSEQDLYQVEDQSNLGADGCRLESPLTNQDLPILGDSGQSSTLVENFKCFFDMRSEIENHIIKENQSTEKERYDQQQELQRQNKDIPSESRVEIEHAFINFIPMINKIKIDLLCKREASSLSYTQYLARINQTAQEFDNIDDLFLAGLLDNHRDDLDFFKQESVQKIVDRQFKYTATFIQSLLIIYSFGFVVPFITNIYIGRFAGKIIMESKIPNYLVIIQLVCFVMCGMTQFFFLTLEMGEIQYSGMKSYFQDGWNYIDSTQYLFYLLRVFLCCDMMNRTTHGFKRFANEMITIIVLLQCCMKFLNLIRYNESFCFLVEMLVQVSKDIYPFLVVFFTFCGVFIMVTYILEGGYDADSYKFMSPFPLIINMLQTFRNSIGDLSNPHYGKWIPENYAEEYLENNYQYAIMAVTWFFFIANIFLMQIVLLNFLIAEVSQTYDRIKNMGSCLMFQKKHELNFFTQKILKLYDKKDPFKALIFVNPSVTEGEEDEYVDIKNFVRDEVQHQIKQLKEQLVPNQEKIWDLVSSNFTEYQKLQEQISLIHKLQMVQPTQTNTSQKQGADSAMNGLSGRQRGNNILAPSEQRRGQRQSARNANRR